MKEMSILPVQLTLMMRTFDGICILLVPAKSAPAYEHQLQQKARILGSKPFFVFFVLALPSPVLLGLTVLIEGSPSDVEGPSFDVLRLLIEKQQLLPLTTVLCPSEAPIELQAVCGEVL